MQDIKLTITLNFFRARGEFAEEEIRIPELDYKVTVKIDTNYLSIKMN